MTIEKLTLAEIMNWLDDLKAIGQSRRHLLNLVSRFFSRAIERGLATVNPVKMIPQGKRPKPQASGKLPILVDCDEPESAAYEPASQAQFDQTCSTANSIAVET